MIGRPSGVRIWLACGVTDLRNGFDGLAALVQRTQCGRSSEHLDQTIAQLELSLEELGASASEIVVPISNAPATVKLKPARRALPESLRETVVHEAPCSCPACGGALRAFGEDIAEILEYVPLRFKVIRHVRPKFSCAGCQHIAQAPAADRSTRADWVGQASKSLALFNADFIATEVVYKLCARSPMCDVAQTARLAFK